MLECGEKQSRGEIDMARVISMPLMISALVVLSLISVMATAPVAQASPYAVDIRITGTSEVDCEFCVDGTIDCFACDGTGHSDCYFCTDGICDACGGAGVETCTLCDGAGIWLDMTCSYCGGDGLVECYSCGGTGECSYCDGKGWETCTMCEGKGGEPCTHCDGEGTVELSFSGSYGDLSGQTSVDGTVPTTYTIGNPSGDIVSAVFQKQTEGGTLTVQLVKDGVVVASQTTTAAYGIVSVSHSFAELPGSEEAGAIIGGIVLFAIFWFIVAILLCVWVYRDAKARGENAALWLIIVLIAGIIGLIIWLIVRPKKKVTG